MPRCRPRRLRPLRLEPLEPRHVLAAGFAEFVDPHPVAGNEFGKSVLPLSTGNVVITSPHDSAGGTDAGAVYLFNGRTGSLISTITGSHANDEIGHSGVTPLKSGNYLILSPFWNNGTTMGVGAVTFGNGITGVSGVVSDANSLVGSKEGDAVGFGGVTVLAKGNYVIANPSWDNNSAKDAGAVTWGSDATGVVGPISASNSLVGGTADDHVGFQITALTNGNYVVDSPSWALPG